MEKKAQDYELLRGCLKKDRKAQKALFEKYFSDMMSVCMRYTRDEDEAKDILQEGFLKVFTKIETFNNEGSLQGWIHRIMVRTAIDHYRSVQREIRLLQSETEKDEHEEAVVEAHMASEEILKIVQKLPDPQRTVFNLFVMDGYSHKEIAEELGTTEGTSKWYLCEARKSLKKMLELHYPLKLKEYA